MMQWRNAAFAGVEGAARTELEALEKRLGDEILALAGAAVAYDPNADPWHGPTNAVNSACWLGAVVGLRVSREGVLPQDRDLQASWRWYEEGHWPHAYDWDEHMALDEAVRRGLLERKLVVF